MIIKTTLEKNGFLGTFYEGSTYADKAVIYVGGTGENRSTVEERASKLCRREGFSVLALGYYLWEGLSKNNFAIPVDYCERAVGWLKNDCPVKINKIAMTGISLGGAYTLLCASLIGDITCAIPVSGYDYVVEGTKNMFFRQHCAMFNYHGHDLPYSSSECLSHIPSTLAALRKNPNYNMSQMNRYYYIECIDNYTEASRIKAENINGDILLIAPGFDDTWPSEIASRRIMKVLEDKGFPHRHECAIYENGSHALAFDQRCDSEEEKKALDKLNKVMGYILPTEKKNPAACAKARQESYFKMVEFLKEWQ